MTALATSLPRNTETLITPSGFARMLAEIERLKTGAREAAAGRLQHALATEADPWASADYLAAREEQALLEARIVRLEKQLETMRVIEPDPTNGVLDLGERVRVRDLDTGRKVEYELVSTLEVDVNGGRISAASPVGRALIGRRKGEVALVDAPARRLRLKILAIEPAAP